MTFVTSVTMAFDPSTLTGEDLINYRNLVPVQVPLTSTETTWHTSRQSQASDFSMNTPIEKTNSHLITPKMPWYPRWVPYIVLGLMWHNAHFNNSCNLDSFLTFLKIMSLKHPNMFFACFRLYDDVVHNTIREIIMAYQSAKHDPQLLNAQDDLARIVWCQNVLGINTIPGRKVDLIGDEERNVFHHMKKSMMFQWVYRCCCIKPQFLTRHTFSVEEGGQTKDLAGSLNPCLGPLFMKKCNRCHQAFVFETVIVPETTWLLRVMIQTFPSNRHNFQNAMHLLPFLSFGKSLFKLGYISFHNKVSPNSNLLHQTSCHLIQDQWFHYDGLNYGGELRNTTNALLPIEKFKPLNAIYFRVH